MPRVTVIIPTYNWAPVLPFAIGSVLDQTFTDFELLVIGDGCTDDSETVVGTITDPRVAWHNLPQNTGHQSGPNNEGLRIAHGDVIAYLGHDDLWLPRHLEVLVGALDARGRSVVHGTTIFVRPGRAPHQLPVRGWTYTPTAWVPPTTVAHTGAIADAVGGWRHPRETGDLDPETDLWGRMAAMGAPPHWARQVTSVKLPAALRRDVYRERPCREQEAWLARIRAEPDPHAAFARMYADRLPWTERAPAALRRAVALRTRLRRLGVIPTRAQGDEESAAARYATRRRFKGLDR